MRDVSIAKGLVPALFTGLLLAGCSGGGSSGASASGEFQLTSISVPQGAVWQVNRAIEFLFSQPVTFGSVGPNTINIQTTDGRPANGVFSLKRVDMDGDGVLETALTDTVVFQPTCPVRADKSDAGLQLGSVSYVITVLGTSSNAQDTVRSENGVRLRTTQTRGFVTPSSFESTSAFLDTVSGPPLPVVRPVGSTLEDGVSYFECGGDPDNRVFFEFDEVTQSFELSEPGFTAPLNLYSDPGSQIAAVIVFNQPVSPEVGNINQNFIRLEFRDGGGAWREFETNVTLVDNCTDSGATVRLEPVGILPVASQIRAVVLPGFRDLTGQEDNPLPLTDFAVAPTETIDFTSLVPADVEGDEVLEEFLIGGTLPGSRQDPDAIFDTPSAVWDMGGLTAGFDFAGTGGPDGEFDWVIGANQTVFLDTVSDVIVGGPGGAPTDQVNVVNGFVDVRDLIIEEGAILRVQGRNPLCINASRNVIIRGTLNLSGTAAKNVTSLNTGNQPEPGGAGVGGGGRGGAGSTVTNNSTPKGEDGVGPFGEPGAGGFGGESGFNGNMTTNVDRRRPGGGGGGRFAADVADSVYGPDPVAAFFPSTNNTKREVFGMRAQPGCDGFEFATSAVTMTSPPLGGAPGVGPFVDGDETNDFWGVRAIDDMGTLTFIRGELDGPTPGYGGGGGGDAAPFANFPSPNWAIGSDEKGGPGGGGAGVLHIKALGDIVFGELGQILCQGGAGATGENTSFLDHVGGGGGGGSGGHVILETASSIDFTDGDPNTVLYGENPFLMDDDLPYQGGRARILANGGEGATIGDNDDGNGASDTLGYGGDGGPGVIQLHVPNPTLRPGTGVTPTDILIPLPAAATAETDYQQILRQIMAPGGIPLVPTFGARSRARSDWITLGEADQADDGSLKQVLFYFDGIDTVDGTVETENGRVKELDPLLEGQVTQNGLVSINAAGDTLELSGVELDALRTDMSTLSNDVYLRTPALLRNFALRLFVDGNPAQMRSYNVVGATYDDAAITLGLMVDVGTLGNNLQVFVDTNPGTIRYELIPRFFRLSTAGLPDVLSDNAKVRISFQATGTNGFGLPDEDNILVDFTSDIAEFNNQAAGAIQFVRFDVEFDLADGAPLTVDTDPVTIDFLRIPFRF